MSIPCKMRPAGLESLPLGYTRVEYLEGTGTQYILVPWMAYDEIEYISQLKETTRQVQCSVGCSDIDNIGIYLTEYDPAGWYCRYGENFYYSATENFHSYEVHEVKIKDFKVYLNKTLFKSIQRNDFEFGNADYIGVFARFTKSKNAIDYAYQGIIYKVSLKSKDIDVYNFIPCLDSTGKPCMFDTVTRKSFYNATTGSDFIVGLTMAQALNLANLPATGGSLTISLPKEATLVQYNQGVEAALNTATEKGWNITVQYRDEFEDESILNKYAKCTTVAQMATVNSDYKNDLTIDGEWIYPIPKLKSGWELFMNATNLKKCSPQIVEHLETQYRLFSMSGLSGEVDYHFPVSASTCSELLYRTKTTKANISLPTATAIGYLVAESYSIEEVGGYFPKATHANQFAQRCSGLKVVNAEFPSLSSGAEMFLSGQLNKESALRVMNSVPAYTSNSHPLGIGIHIDHKTDAEVLAAIANAEVKGWTLTVRWNGTPTDQSASTFGLRKPPIYAKLGTLELPDKTIENFLDWGHYVTNWEENGYQEFSSVEEAEEYFNIKNEIEE